MDVISPAKFELTLDMLNNPVHADKVLATGVVMDSVDGLNMTGSGRNLRWVLQIGTANDWAIYCHWASLTPGWVALHGDKIVTTSNIRNIIDCDDDVMSHYRH